MTGVGCPRAGAGSRTRTIWLCPTARAKMPSPKKVGDARACPAHAKRGAGGGQGTGIAMALCAYAPAAVCRSPRASLPGEGPCAP